MAADAWSVYDTFKEYMCDGTCDLDGDTFKMALYLSTSDCNNDTKDLKGNISNEHANSNGYTTGGYTVAATWVRSGGTVTFDCADGVWTASGGSIVCRYAVIYDDTPTSPADPLVCWTTLDNTPQDVTVTNGNQLTVQINASGVFTLT